MPFGIRTIHRPDKTMSYKFSICHPEKEEIEYPNTTLNSEQVKELATKYPWESELRKLKTMRFEEIHYNPSVDFTNQSNNRSFCLTVEREPENFKFSVWYNRPKMKKVLFGLLGQKEKLEVIDKSFTQEEAYKLLDVFLSGDYLAVEKEMN